MWHNLAALYYKAENESSNSPHTAPIPTAANAPGWSFDQLTVLPLLTFLILLTHAPDVWYLRTPLMVLVILAMVYEPLRRTSQLWFCVSVLLGATIYLHWESSDNHKYVIAYWCLILCSAFTVAPERQAETMQLSSRWLIGLCMLWATAWKIATPDYRDGTFFTYELLADERFARFTELFGGLPLSALGENRELRELLLHGYERGIELTSVAFQSSSAVVRWAWLLTWWTVLIEGALAIVFLWRDSPRVAAVRNGMLLFFAVTTYSVATVRGFGWMLMLLGMAQTQAQERKWRVAYLVVFLLIQLYTLPAASLWETFK